MIYQVHSRYQHLYVVVRVDDVSVAERVEDRVSLVAAFRGEDEAQAESERLNELAEAKDSHYRVIVTRLKGGNAPPPVPSTAST